MYIDVVPNRGSRPAVLLRESFREGKKVKKRTLANLSHWPESKIERLRAALKSEHVITSFEITRSLRHGAVAAVLGTVRRLGLDRMIVARRSRSRDLVVAMIVARVISPSSKLALCRGLDPDQSTSSLGDVLGLGAVSEQELYDAMDWLAARQGAVEKKLVARHLDEGSMILFDVTSVHFEGRHCPLAEIGYAHSGPKGKLQIHIGLLCDQDGRPLAVEVFKGSLGDPKALTAQVAKVRKHFGLRRLIWVGDRGTITSARIREDLEPEEGFDWITALRSVQIRTLVRKDAFQPSLFDKRDLGEITSPDYPGERLIVCRNPLLADERHRKRQALLTSTEVELRKITAATRRKARALRGQDEIGLRVGRVLGRFKMAKHFLLTISDDAFTWERNLDKIAKEEALDGFYIVRTSVPAEEMSADAIVASYKGLSRVETAFKLLKTIDLNIRPIRHRLEKRVRAHVMLCMLAYYVEWHMREALATLLFDDHDRQAARELRASSVAKAKRSPAALRKAASKRNDEGFPVNSFRSILDSLDTIVKNTVVAKMPSLDQQTLTRVTIPNHLQTKALDLLSVSL